jgi:hypothetical protein
MQDSITVQFTVRTSEPVLAIRKPLMVVFNFYVPWPVNMHCISKYDHFFCCCLNRLIAPCTLPLAIEGKASTYLPHIKEKPPPPLQPTKHTEIPRLL